MRPVLKHFPACEQLIEVLVGVVRLKNIVRSDLESPVDILVEHKIATLSVMDDHETALLQILVERIQNRIQSNELAGVWFNIMTLAVDRLPDESVQSILAWSEKQGQDELAEVREGVKQELVQQKGDMQRTITRLLLN